MVQTSCRIVEVQPASELPSFPVKRGSSFLQCKTRHKYKCILKFLFTSHEKDALKDLSSFILPIYPFSVKRGNRKFREVRIKPDNI